MWADVVKFLGGTAILLGAIAWLIRSLMMHLLTKDIERFKQELRTDAEKELTELRARLEIENAKLQIKLSALQSRRIEFIEELYGLLVEFSGEADVFAVEPRLEDDEELKKKADKFIDKFFEFYRFFERHEIFVPKDIEDQIKSLHASHFNAALNITYANSVGLKSAISAFRKDSQSIMEKSNAIRRRLAAEFRRLLGVES